MRAGYIFLTLLLLSLNLHLNHRPTTAGLRVPVAHGLAYGTLCFASVLQSSLDSIKLPKTDMNNTDALLLKNTLAVSPLQVLIQVGFKRSLNPAIVKQHQNNKVLS